MLKIFRFYVGGYTPDYAKLKDLGCMLIKQTRPIISVINANQGFGVIKGITKKQGKIYPVATVCCFKRSTRELLWETTPKQDGTYFFRNIAKGLECFVVAFDQNEQCNAVISDKLVAK